MKTRCAILVSGLLLLAPWRAAAQSADPYFTDFSANYDIIYHQPNETSNAGAHFDIATTIKRDTPIVALAGEVGFNHFDGATVASFLGGPRLRFPNLSPSVLPFAQLLIGLYHCGVCNVNDFALQGGGGLDFRLSENNVRFRTQVDVRHVFDSFESFNAVRISVGIVLPLNR